MIDNKRLSSAVITGTAVITRDGTRIFAYPSYGSAIVAELAASSVVEVVYSSRGGWSNVSVAGHCGWIRDEYFVFGNEGQAPDHTHQATVSFDEIQELTADEELPVQESPDQLAESIDEYRQPYVDQSGSYSVGSNHELEWSSASHQWASNQTTSRGPKLGDTVWLKEYGDGPFVLVANGDPLCVEAHTACAGDDADRVQRYPITETYLLRDARGRYMVVPQSLVTIDRPTTRSTVSLLAARMALLLVGACAGYGAVAWGLINL